MRGVIDLLIARTIEKLSERLSYLEKKDKELRKSVYMVDGRVRVPDDELDELRTELACLNARQDDIVKRMNHFTNRGPDDPMSHLQSVRNANSRLAERIEDLDKREARLVERVIAIEGNLDQFMEETSKQLGGDDPQQVYWREQIQTLQGAVNRLETIIKQLFGPDLDALARSTQLETVFDRLNQLSKKVAESQKNVETHWLDDQRALVSFQEELAELGKTLEATAEGQARELAAFREHVNRQYAEWTERLETSAEGQARELEVLRNHVNTQVSKLAHEDSVFHDFVTAFRGRLENLDKSVSSINEYRIRDTTELKEIVKKLSTDLDGLRADFEFNSQLSKRVTNTNEELEVLRNHVNTQVSKLAHEDSVFRRNHVNTLSKHVTKIEGELELLRNRVNQLFPELS